TGQFMVMTRDGGVSFVQERWLLTFHCTLSPEQILRLKQYGLTPYAGQLDTSIRAIDVAPDRASNTEYLWREFFEALGTARRHLESLIASDGSNERARVILEILKDPEATYRRLQAAMQRAAELETKEGTRVEPPRSGLMDLLSAQKLTKAALSEGHSP